MALWAPAVTGIITAGLLLRFDSADLDTDDLGRVASLCASLLIAGLAGVGLVALFGATGTSPDRTDRVIKQLETCRKVAGFGVMASLILTCAAIVAGGLAILGWLTTFLCFAGLVTAVVQIFGVPLSLVAARSTGQPFILDGRKLQ